MKSYRFLKIHQKFRSRTWDNTCVPEIRLEGRWLQHHGFYEGARVRVEVRYKKVIITLEEEKGEGP